MLSSPFRIAPLGIFAFVPVLLAEYVGLHAAEPAAVPLSSKAVVLGEIRIAETQPLIDLLDAAATHYFPGPREDFGTRLADPKRYREIETVWFCLMPSRPNVKALAPPAKVDVIRFRKPVSFEAYCNDWLKKPFKDTEPTTVDGREFRRVGSYSETLAHAWDDRTYIVGQKESVTLALRSLESSPFLKRRLAETWSGCLRATFRAGEIRRNFLGGDAEHLEGEFTWSRTFMPAVLTPGLDAFRESVPSWEEFDFRLDLHGAHLLRIEVTLDSPAAAEKLKAAATSYWKTVRPQVEAVPQLLKGVGPGEEALAGLLPEIAAGLAVSGDGSTALLTVPRPKKLLEAFDAARTAFAADAK